MANKRGGHYFQGHTRYQPLVDYLAACNERETAPTLDQIEAILGMTLNDGAHVNAYFWARPQFRYVQQWRALGWRACLDRRNRCVIFTHDVGKG